MYACSSQQYYHSHLLHHSHNLYTLKSPSDKPSYITMGMKVSQCDYFHMPFLTSEVKYLVWYNFKSYIHLTKVCCLCVGLAAVNGVCVPGYSVVLGELGATNAWGRPYPTAGFAALYVAAHEIGHR